MLELYFFVVFFLNYSLIFIQSPFLQPTCIFSNSGKIAIKCDKSQKKINYENTIGSSPLDYIYSKIASRYFGTNFGLAIQHLSCFTRPKHFFSGIRNECIYALCTSPFPTIKQLYMSLSLHSQLTKKIDFLSFIL